jgi:prevent-host-death family protein
MKAAQKHSRIHGIREVKANLSLYIEKAKKEPVIITNHGKPEALLINVAGMDAEDVILFTSKAFQKALHYDPKKLVPIEEMLAKYAK